MLPGSRNRSPIDEQGLLAARRPYLELRARMIQAIRMFFIEQDFLEVDTPLLIPAPAPEPHIDAIKAGTGYLHTSPELCMKRLLAAGYPRIFQISKCFRDGERGKVHLPEFTLLEWYRIGIDYKELMEDCEELILRVARDLGMGEKIPYKGTYIDLKKSWERISLSEAFDRFSHLTLEMAIQKDRFDEVLVREIEPCLGRTGPTILYDYPVSLASLARLRRDNPEVAERFEVYVGGVELANGFSELTDSGEQRARFIEDRMKRRDSGKQVYPMPEKFLEALKDMPEAAGIALGVDRLAMILADRPEIDHVVSFTPEEI